MEYINSELIQERENSLKYLFDNDKKIESSNYIFKQSLKEYSNTIKLWLGDSRTVDILLQAADDDNLKVRINIVGALWMISNRYLKDIRIFKKLIYTLEDRNCDIRNYSALGLSNYSFDDKWDTLITQLEKEKTNKVVESILKNVYIKSSLAVWGEISDERVTDILERFDKIYRVTDKEKKIAIGKAINWIKQNLR
jgi:hypothetical protein